MVNDKKIVVSFADGAGNYAKAMMRLELSLKQVGFNGEFKGYNDYGHIGSPFHKGNKNAIPYAFKAYAIKKAMEVPNVRYILWCDSVVYATKSIDPVFDYIKEHGYLLFDNIGYSIGDYTSDACLEKWDMSREEAFKEKMLMACVMGFDLANEKAKEFLDKYISAASDGVSYIGDWFNNDLQVSVDQRCFGHRHDQSTAAIIANQLNMKITNAQSSFFAYVEHKGKIDLSEKICLWSGGVF